jgi:hypothetical protein
MQVLFQAEAGSLLKLVIQVVPALAMRMGRDPPLRPELQDDGLV